MHTRACTHHIQQDQNHMHAIDFHHFNNMITIIVCIMYRVVVQGPRVVMKMFGCEDISAIQSKEFVTYTPYSGD